MSDQNRPDKKSTPGKAGIWLARCGAVVLSLFALVYLVVIVIHGAVTGSIHVVSKYSRATVSIETEPVLFGITIFYQLAVSSLLSYFAYLCWVGGGWLKRSERLELVSKKLEAKIPSPRKPLPTWVSIVVLSCFFCFLLAMCARVSPN